MQSIQSFAEPESKAVYYRILEGRKANAFIGRIGKLLYDVYIDECNWEFGTDNPSNLSIETDRKGNKMLVDKFTRDEDFIEQTTWIVSLTTFIDPLNKVQTLPKTL